MTDERRGAGPRSTPVAGSSWRLHSLGGVIRIYFCLLPLAALGAAYVKTSRSMLPTTRK